MTDGQIFSSFWMAGFESACHVNSKGVRLDMIHATQHDRFIDEDYENLTRMGLRSVRETVRWHLVERTPGVFDFESMDLMIDAARRHGIQLVWDLCHYGWPDGLDIFSVAFIDRFARFARAVAKHVRDSSDGVPLYTPVNEMSFFAWAAGEVGWFYPYGKGRGGELKRQLIRACIAGINAIWDLAGDRSTYCSRKCTNGIAGRCSSPKPATLASVGPNGFAN
jgi:beta-glucosidase/6-phospho-beta-glucosidase/beta-galactosidase